MLQRLIKLNHNWFSIFLPKCDLPTPTVFPISINGQNIESSSTPFSHNPHLTYQKISLALPFFFSLGRVSDLLKCDKYDVNRNLETNKGFSYLCIIWVQMKKLRCQPFNYLNKYGMQKDRFFSIWWKLVLTEKLSGYMSLPWSLPIIYLIYTWKCKNNHQWYY